MRLSAKELERYARHIVLPEIGGSGQQKLKKAKVLVVGAGGLGSPCLEYLAAAGVGTIGIVDHDTVSISNLQRQTIHSTKAASKEILKVESAAIRLCEINPHVKIERWPVRLTGENALALVSACTLTIDGSDNFSTRFALADACEFAKVPLITAAVGRFDGSITTLLPFEKNADGIQNPGYRDLYPEQPPDDMLPTCEEAGVLGALTGMMGTLQAMEAIKLITGTGECLIGRLLMVDAARMRFDKIKYSRKGT